MINYLINSSASLIGGLVLMVITVLAVRLSRTFSAKRIWRLKKPEELVICISTSAKTITETYIRFSSGLGQIRALAILMPSLSQAYRDIDTQRIMMSDDEIGDRAEQDLIILGGPKNNRIAKEILDMAKNEIPVELLEPALKWKDASSIEEFVPLYENDDVSTDFGLILRIRNPHNPKKTIVLLAGTHTYGTTAAARYFVTEMNKIRFLFYGDFVAVVKARVTDRHVSQPELVKIAKIRRSRKKA
ncbi:hypothetical protein ACFFUT_09120 [Pseudohalocynthiibacter aestuariivivens]|uniref:S-layer protein outer domain-containing protein n=1 Tax=Pseudohalocynthiibacter aestuariivivens TaxID=1591409 RepID=A0ABV5JET2_9RHOB|nr:hypothetical protein [Pseudohalocynthiibacter aestuariivivens]MBS9718493.1 hypothetical protein [Pseudohalocynthiibacter aestuariivivens]